MLWVLDQLALGYYMDLFHWEKRLALSYWHCEQCGFALGDRTGMTLAWSEIGLTH